MLLFVYGDENLLGILSCYNILNLLVFGVVNLVQPTREGWELTGFIFCPADSVWAREKRLLTSSMGDEITYLLNQRRDNQEAIALIDSFSQLLQETERFWRWR